MELSKELSTGTDTLVTSPDTKTETEEDAEWHDSTLPKIWFTQLKRKYRFIMSSDEPELDFDHIPELTRALPAPKESLRISAELKYSGFGRTN